MDRISVVLIALLCLCKTLTVYAQPDFPALNDRVVDLAALLDAETEAALISELEAHEQATSNQIVVATVPTLQGYAISDYANQLARHWAIGQAEVDNGVLLLVAPEERKVRIEVGYGLEGSLTDATSADIIRRQILPHFREDDYSKGITQGIKSILSAIDGEYEVQPVSRSAGKSGLDRYFPLLFIGLIFLFEILKKFGFSRLGTTAFPTAMAGIAVTAISSNLLLGILAAVVVFLLMFFWIKPGRGTGNRSMHPQHREDRNQSRHANTGGGFSGGGGSFGGGGASGSW